MSAQSIWLIGFPNLITTVVTSASILPLTISIKIDNSYLKLLWRNLTMVPFLVALSFLEIMYMNRKRPPGDQIIFKKVCSQIYEARIDLVLCGLSLLAMQVTYLLSGDLTIMTHATLFTNLTPFMLVVLRFVMRQKIHKLETYGTVIAILGCIVTV